MKKTKAERDAYEAGWRDGAKTAADRMMVGIVAVMEREGLGALAAMLRAQMEHDASAVNAARD